MPEVFIDAHAFKHGLSEDEIAYAWENFLRRQYRGAPNEGEVVAVGYTRDGRLVQLVAAEKSFGTLIYHALEPPTTKVLVELGLMRGNE